MTDSSMNFGPAWIRNLRSEGTTGSGSGSGGGASGTNTGTTRYQLAEHRYGREEMLAIFDRTLKPPPSLTAFKALYSEQILTPLALLSTAEEERSWQARPSTLTPACRGRGVSLEHRGGGRPTRGGRGNYPTYGRTTSAAAAYDSGWGNGEQPEWSSPRKEYNTRSNSTDNWRRVRNNNNNNTNNNNNDDDDGWRSITSNRPLHDKWGRSTSWRGGEGDADERNGPPPERGGGRVQQHWHENRSSSTSSSSLRRSWDIDDHLPEWIHENPTEGGGTFDERGAFHGSDDEHFCGGDHQQQQQQQKRKELQKSASQQQISNSRNHPPSLTTSKSAIALSKINDNDKQSENLNERDKEPSKIKEESDPQSEKARINNDDEGGNRSSKIEEDTKSAISDRNRDNRNSICTNNGPPSDSSSRNIDKVEEEFARMQEDLVLKLVVDEETPKTTLQSTSSPSTVTGVPTTTTSTTTTYDVTTNPIVQPPPNLVVPPPPLPPPPQQEKWYYQDPQGTRQGPFLNVEMAEWYKAGYFSNQLRVMRECDERYFLLGELINLCGGDNPFLSNVRFPILKNDTQHQQHHQQQQQQQTKLNDDMLSYQLLSQLAFKQQISMRNLAEPWSALTLQQQELAAQRLLLHQQQQQQQLPHELQFIQQTTPPPPPPANPLMFMINQMQQSNKLPGTVLVDKPNSGSSVPNQLVVDPLLVQMGGGGIHSLQNRIPTPNLHNHLPGGLATTDSLTGGGGGGLPGLPTAAGLPNHRPITTTTNSPIDQENDPITNFLKQFHQQQQKQQRTQIPPIDGSLWHNQPNQFNVPQSTTTTQWAQQPDVPLSMWDLQPPDNHQSIPIDKTTTTDPKQNHEIDNEQQQQHKLKEETTTATTQKELKKKKELDEKQAKREAEEKRKQEQRKQEADRRAIEEKKKKEEERIRKELERAKREAEEKRMRELEEKRRLKEQRKADEEAKKKSDELRKQEDDKLKKEAREREERKQAELRLTQQQHQVIKATTSTTKTAPWCQSNSTQGVSLTDIQKAEKERRAQEAALLLKQQQLQEQQQQQQQQQAEKQPGGLLQLNWAKKPMEPRSVKSFAEIQAEEQEKLAKMTAEARLAAQQREKEAPTTSNTNSIWNGQSLSWANATSTSQWSSNNAGAGFWDDVFVKSSTNKPSTIAVPKSSSTSAMTSVATATATAAATTATVKQQQQQQQKQTKPKPKKEESQKSVNSSNNNNNNNNNSANDEFTNWCYKTLSTISTNVDIPTFVSFLRDIESAYDVKDYCKEYLGDGAAIQQFAANFLEKRRSFKPKTNAHKDDMCSPAPAITPSTTTQQHNSTEFQEVKGKNKKNKKSKMLKVDARILGFQVTSAPDRINVGDRDYGDNS